MKAPVLFMGHGSPMNIIEDNQWTRQWSQIGEKLASVEGIAMISAHWYTDGIYVTEEEKPKTIYDMFGFPDELYEVEYGARNPVDFRDRVFDSIKSIGDLSDKWGYDHGNYSVLHHMFPKRDKPLLQISINKNEGPLYHYELGAYLNKLREENILIIGSGNIVHNLYMMRASIKYSWAEEFDNKIYDLVLASRDEDILDLNKTREYQLACPTPDHYYPFLVALGAKEKNDRVEVVNKEMVNGSLSMTSYLWGI